VTGRSAREAAAARTGACPYKYKSRSGCLRRRGNRSIRRCRGWSHVRRDTFVLDRPKISFSWLRLPTLNNRWCTVVVPSSGGRNSHELVVMLGVPAVMKASSPPGADAAIGDGGCIEVDHFRGSKRRNATSRHSIRQIKKFAPAIGADVAFHDLAGARLAEEAAGGASQPVFRLILIFRISLRDLLLRRCRRDCEPEDAAGQRRLDEDAPQHAARVRPRCGPSRSADCCGPARSSNNRP
jgi:hypothetical protein